VRAWCASRRKRLHPANKRKEYLLNRVPIGIYVAAAAIALSSCGSDYYDLTDLEMERVEINAKRAMRPSESFASRMNFEISAEKDGLVMCFLMRLTDTSRS
jgi:cytochrome c-type biogenesis protein CcmH/NrfG